MTDFKTVKDIDFDNLKTQSTIEINALKLEIKRLKSIQFPTTLRKMWSGGEVQAWLNNELRGLE